MSVQPELFRPVDSKRRALLVAEQVLAAIRNGTLRPGDRLPAERDLAEQTGVSRPSVREALSALQLIGAIETRHGQGTFVAVGDNVASRSLQLLTDLYDSPGLADSLEVRRVLEKAMAFLIVQRLDRTDDGPLELALGDLERAAAAADFEAFNAANSAFHRAYAELCDNPLLSSTLAPVTESMQTRLAVDLRKQRYWTEREHFTFTLRAHERILEAIRAGDLELLLTAVDEHYDSIEQTL